MDKRREVFKCFACGKFLKKAEAFFNWTNIQNPNCVDPDPYEIMWCNRCNEKAKSFGVVLDE